MRDGFADLSPAQQRLISFLLENLPTVSDLTITELADAAGVSVGTISGLSRRLGLRGYQDLRLTLAREAVLADATETGGHRLEIPAGPPVIRRAVERAFGHGLESLVSTAVRLDTLAMEQAVEAILSARRVECIGVGTAGLLALEAALKLRKVGVDAVAHADAHVQAMSASLLQPGDVVVAISHSGRTIDTVRAARLALARGATVVAITSEGRSPLADVAFIRLSTTSSDTGFQVEPMASTIAALAVIETLFLAILERAGDEGQERLSRTQAAVEDRHITGRTW
jgi:DNA-binding MurR/RpiR family transcriptional regulator